MQSTDGAEIVGEARSWVGTRYRHQGRLKGLAVDCVGLILGVGHEVGLLDISPEAWARFAGYSRTPNPEHMRAGMEAFLEELAFPPELAAPDGAIGWFQWREDLPMHLAIMAAAADGTGRRTMIHAYERASMPGENRSGWCVEHGFDAEWPAQVNSWWAYPGSLPELARV